MRINSVNGSYPSLNTFYRPTASFDKKISNETNYVDIPRDFNYGYQEINFTGQKKSLNDHIRFRNSRKNFSPEAEDTYIAARVLARKYGSSEIESWHLYLASLITAKRFINDLDSGAVKYDEQSRLKLPFEIQKMVSIIEGPYFEEKKSRDKIREVVDKHIKKTVQKFAPPKEERHKPSLSYPQISKRALGDMLETYDILANAAQSNTFFDSYFYAMSFYSQDRKLVSEANEFNTDLQKALMIDDSNKKKKNHLKFYDDKADCIWKNVNLGNDTVFVYDSMNRESSDHLVSSFLNLINKPGQTYKNIDPAKTDIIVLKRNATFELFNKLSKEAKENPKKKGRTTVIVADLYSLVTNSQGTLGAEDLKCMLNENKENVGANVRLVFGINRESYYANTDKKMPLSKILNSYSLQTIPSLNENDAIKYLTDKDGVKFVQNEVKKELEPEVIQRAVELTSGDDGNYPDKAINFIQGAINYYSEGITLNSDLLERFALESKGLSEVQGTDGDSGKIVYDTGKRLSDIVGSPMTKADAESIVKQIVSGKVGTKGFTAQLSNGSSYGGGRRHTAEAIAGEAGIPMIIINAEDFALKDIDTLSQNADVTEMKIKNIVSNAKAQAQVNKHKAAMIFVENFDNFAPNPLVMGTSIYEKKAFSQLLSEMESTRKNDGINLIVVGSVNNGFCIDPNILKPYKFLNSIIVFPPQDSNERKEVLDYYIKKMKLEIAGDTEEERAKTVKSVADTTDGFTVVDLMYLLETAKNVSLDRQKDKIDNTDFTEAYLQTISGRTNRAYIPEARKRIVASHEAGHALTLQVMYETAKSAKIPWHLPDEVNFITLDPRGDFGGAMFHKSSDNQEVSFEKMMSDLVCSYGGHSAESSIYNMSGSWGITADMQHTAGLARAAVLDMGMGPKTGVCHIPRNQLGSPDVSDKKLQTIEEDIDLFTSQAKKISDLIVETYKDFIIQFTDKYAPVVGTGECIVSGEQFISELNNYRDGLTPEQRQKVDGIQSQIMKIMEETKNPKND